MGIKSSSECLYVVYDKKSQNLFVMSDRKINEFNSLIMPHLNAAYNYAYWLTHNAQNAEDLTQEAFARALAAFDGFRKQQPKAWLMTILRNTFINQINKQKRRGEVIYLDTIQPDCHSSENLTNTNTPEQEILRNSDIKLVRVCINLLAGEYQEVIMLRELEGFSYDEISQILDCPLGTVMSRLSRARKCLKQLVLKHGYQSEEQA